MIIKRGFAIDACVCVCVFAKRTHFNTILIAGQIYGKLISKV